MTKPETLDDADLRNLARDLCGRLLPAEYTRPLILLLVKDALTRKRKRTKEARRKAHAERVALRPPKKKWYVIAVRPRQERNARRRIRREARKGGWGKLVGRLAVPVDRNLRLVNTKNGQVRRLFNDKRLPNYLLARLSLTDDVWHLVRGTRGVVGFLPFGQRPVTIPDDVVRQVCAPAAGERPTSKKAKAPDYKAGDRVLVLKNTPWVDMEGVVRLVRPTPDGPLLHVEVKVLGAPTLVKLDWWSVKRIT